MSDSTLYLKGDRSSLEEKLPTWIGGDSGAKVRAAYDVDKPIEYQTDKEQMKLLPCVECAAPVACNVFYAPAICRCSEHGGGTKRAAREAGSATGGQAIVQPGRTAPEKAANLADCLINRQFAEAPCPLCSDMMELKSVSHNPSYGPRHLKDVKNGIPIYDQQIGETALLQCNHCRVVVSMSTAHTVVYRRQNEPKASTGRESGWGQLLGTRE